MPFHRLYFNLMRLLCPAKPAMTKSKKLIFDTCDVISDLQTKFCRIFGKFKSGAIKCHFRIENRPSGLADSTGAETPPPPHRRVGSGNTPSGRGLTVDPESAPALRNAQDSWRGRSRGVRHIRLLLIGGSSWLRSRHIH